MGLYDEASLQIQWIEMIYNTTDVPSSTRRDPSRPWSRDAGPQGDLLQRRDLSSRTGSGNCKVVCSIDEVAEPGAATMLWNSTATRMAGADAANSMAWAWALFVGSLVWLIAT